MRKLLFAGAAALLAQSLPVVAADEKPLGILFAVGDVAECTKDPNQKFKSGEAIAVSTTTQIKKAQHDIRPDIPVAVLALGPRPDHRGTPEGFECFRKHWGGSLRDVLYPVPGNHEYDRKDSKGNASSKGTKHASPFFDHFTDAPGGNRFKDTVKQHGDSAGYYFVDFPETAAKPASLSGRTATSILRPPRRQN